MSRYKKYNINPLKSSSNYMHHLLYESVSMYFILWVLSDSRCKQRLFREISSSHGGEYDVQSCLLGYTAV
jgi:hypothetical protein